jgi:hypothetical protein
MEMIQEKTELQLKYEEKRKSALAYLGEHWVLHKNYVFNPKHSTNIFVKKERKNEN